MPLTVSKRVCCTVHNVQGNTEVSRASCNAASTLFQSLLQYCTTLPDKVNLHHFMTESCKVKWLHVPRLSHPDNEEHSPSQQIIQRHHLRSTLPFSRFVPQVRASCCFAVFGATPAEGEEKQSPRPSYAKICEGVGGCHRPVPGMYEWGARYASLHDDQNITVFVLQNENPVFLLTAASGEREASPVLAEG